MKRLSGMTGVLVSSLAVLLVVVVGWVFFVSPERSKADSLDSQKAMVDSQLATDQALLAAPREKQTVNAVLAAQRALPDQQEVSTILRQLQQLAAQSRTQLESITPSAAVQVGNVQAIPISLAFTGRYFGLQKLLQLLRQSADVRGGKLVSTGRLYTVDSIQFAGGQSAAAGQISATITLNAFVYGGAPAATPATPATTTPATTTTTTSGASAAAPAH